MNAREISRMSAIEELKQSKEGYREGYLDGYNEAIKRFQEVININFLNPRVIVTTEDNIERLKEQFNI